MASSDPLDTKVQELVKELLAPMSHDSDSTVFVPDWEKTIRQAFIKLIEEVIQDSPTTKLVLAVQDALPQLVAMRDQARYVISKGEHSAAAIMAQGKLGRIIQAHGELILAAGPVEAHQGRHGHG